VSKKRTQSILLIVVVLIWGAVLYQIFGPEEKNPVQIDNSFQTEVQEFEEVIKEQKLTLSYQDPFLNGKYINGKRKSEIASEPIQQRTQSINKPTIVESIKPKKVMWPNISIGGLVNKQLLIKINAKHFILDKSDTIQGIIFNFPVRDSIQVKHEHETKMFKMPN
jgi:hypothetical protein